MKCVHSVEWLQCTDEGSMCCFYKWLLICTFGKNAAFCNRWIVKKISIIYKSFLRSKNFEVFIQKTVAKIYCHEKYDPIVRVSGR